MSKESNIIGAIMELLIMAVIVPPAIDTIVTEEYYRLYGEDISNGMRWLFVQ